LRKEQATAKMKYRDLSAPLFDGTVNSSGRDDVFCCEVGENRQQQRIGDGYQICLALRYGGGIYAEEHHYTNSGDDGSDWSSVAGPGTDCAGGDFVGG
jgi:hypothetical protein